MEEGVDQRDELGLPQGFTYGAGRCAQSILALQKACIDFLDFSLL